MRQPAEFQRRRWSAGRWPRLTAVQTLPSCLAPTASPLHCFAKRPPGSAIHEPVRRSRCSFSAIGGSHTASQTGTAGQCRTTAGHPASFT